MSTNTSPRQIATGQLVFSIINIVLGCCGLGGILGIIALIMTIVAKNAPTDAEADKKVHTAKILNIIAIIGIAISTIISVLYMAFGGFSVLMAAMSGM